MRKSFLATSKVGWKQCWEDEHHSNVDKGELMIRYPSKNILSLGDVEKFIYFFLKRGWIRG